MKNAADSESNRSISSGISANNIIKVKGIGPNGWENAIHKIILELN